MFQKFIYKIREEILKLKETAKLGMMQKGFSGSLDHELPKRNTIFLHTIYFQDPSAKKSCLYSFCACIQCLVYSTAQYLASYFSKGLPSNTELIHQTKLLRDWTSQLMEMY